MKAFVTVTQQQFDISAEQGVPAGDVLTQSVEFGNFIKGKDGTIIYNGSGVPENILGVNGDFYIDNVAPNNYYEKISGSWVLQGHFQGEKGEYTVVTIGENGNWYIDGEDSGQRAIGIDGYTPIIGENDNWWINGVDTGKRAVGIDGVGISNWELVSTVGKVKTYRITFTDSTTFEYSITDGTDGNDGREVLIQNNGTYIQWQYEGDEAWNNIVELSTLKGEKGDSGANIELQKSITHIQWRVVGDTNWIDLIALEDLKGIEGRGIVSIIKTSTVGLVDTYTITYSDSTTSTFDVTNGENAYQSALDGGYTGTEAEFNLLFNSIDEHIADDSIHHTFDEIRDDLGINEETGSESKYLNEKGEMSEIVIGSGGYSAHVYATTINSDIAGYKKSSYTAETSETVISTTLSNSTVLVEEYIFDAPLGITQIPNGSWLFHYYAKIGATNPQGAKLRFEVYTRGTTGTETLLFTKDTPTFTNTDYVQVLPVEFIGNLYTCLATDRIVFKVYVVTTSVPNVTVSYIVGDGRGLYVDSPIQLRHSQTREKNEELVYQHVDSTTELGEAINETTHSLLLWNGLKSLKVTFARMKTWLSSSFLKLDQTVQQTLTSSPKIDDLVAGQMCYVDANKQLKPINVFWDNVNNRMGINGSGTANLYVGGTGYFLNNTTINGLVLCNSGVRTNLITDGSSLVNSTLGVIVTYINDGVKTNLSGYNNLLHLKPKYNQVASTSENIDLLIERTETSVGSGKQLLIQALVNSVEKFSVQNNGNVKAAGGIQCGDDTAAASADKLGTRRRRTGVNGNIGFYVSEECSQKGVNEYEWTEIFRNEWIIP